MNRTKWILAVTTVLMIGGTAAVLSRVKSVQRLGEPGVKTQAIAGSRNLEVVLPERVLDYHSRSLPLDAIVTNNLPADTSFGQRQYVSSDSNHAAQVTVVLMGADRASLHKPQYCLTGAGWTINKTEIDTIRVEKPAPYDLSVIKLTVSGQFQAEGQPVNVSGVYVYWYVADGDLSASPTGFDRMWSIGRDLITTGVLQRWAYISYFSYGQPGSENQLYERTKQLIAASVPEYQLTPNAGTQVAERKP
jgi:hypothetical protein